MDLKDIKNNEKRRKMPVKKVKESLALRALPSGTDQMTTEKKCGSLETEEMMIKTKQVKGLQMLMLQTGTSQSGEGVREIPPITFSSVVYENVKFAFLTRSIVQKLLERPESFEDKVKGAFVCVEIPLREVNRKTSKLVQVTGITKTSTCQENMEVKLQALDIPSDISIDMLSNAFLSEEQSESLRHELKVGLREMPTIEELHLKVISLHEDIIDECISRELRILQGRMQRALEKGWRQEYKDLSRRREQLQSPLIKEQLVNSVSKMVDDIQVFSEEILKDKQGKQCLAESTTSKAMVMVDDNQYKGSSTSIPASMGLKGNVSTSAEKQVGEVMKDSRTPVSVPRKTEENPPRRSFLKILQNSVVEEQNGKSVAVETSANLPSKDLPLNPIPSPQQGVVAPVHLSPTIMQKPNQQPHSIGGIDLNGPVDFDDITLNPAKDVEVLADEELLNIGNQYDAKMFSARRELMRRFEKRLKEQRCFDAERQKLEMNVVEANHKCSVAEDELKKLKAKVQEEVELSARKMRRMEMDVQSGASRIRKMEMDAEVNAAKIRKLEEDAQGSAARIKKMENEAQLSGAKIRKMEEDAASSKIKMSKMEEDARSSKTKISKLEDDAQLASTTIRTLRTKLIKLWESQQRQQTEEIVSRYKMSKDFRDDIFKLLSPVYSSGFTDALLQVKAEHLADLDLSKFPNFDLNCWNKMDQMYNLITSSGVLHEQLSQVSQSCRIRRPGDSSGSTSGL